MAYTKESLVKELIGMGIKDRKVLDAVEKTKRELFIPRGYMEEAYANYPLYIGHGQTISQPYTVAFMIELLELKKGLKVLEVGAGSGYNAAVMSTIVGKEGKITATEIIPELAETAAKNLEKASIKNVAVVEADGSRGYAKEAPYDRIIVTAAAPELKQEWIEQLKGTGILVFPLGEQHTGQAMIKIRKKGSELIGENHGSFMFVPLRTDKNK